VAIGGTNAFGSLDIAGTASLNGTVHVVRVGSFLPSHNDEFTILIASNGVSGTFSTFTNDIAHSLLLNPQLIYGTNDVILEWTQASFVSFCVDAEPKGCGKSPGSRRLFHQYIDRGAD